MQEVKIIDIDNVQWNIKDQEARNKIAELEEKTTKNFEYSKIEQKIGKWVDGGDLYRLVVKGNTTENNVIINLADKNIKDIIQMNGTCNALNQFIFSIPYCIVTENEPPNTYFTQIYYNIANKQIELYFGKALYFEDVTFSIQIEYTKNN